MRYVGWGPKNTSSFGNRNLGFDECRKRDAKEENSSGVISMDFSKCLERDNSVGIGLKTSWGTYGN